MCLKHCYLIVGFGHRQTSDIGHFLPIFFFMNALSKAKRIINGSIDDIEERRRYEDLLALNLGGAFPPTPPHTPPHLYQ